MPLLYGATEHCPVRTMRRWLDAAAIASGPAFRRIWPTPACFVAPDQVACYMVGEAAIQPITLARIVRARAAAAGFDPNRMVGHSLERGALTTGMEPGTHPTRLKRLGRLKNYAMLDEYLELGEPFDNHPLGGVPQAPHPEANRFCKLYYDHTIICS